jgi:hypothetical protein
MKAVKVKPCKLCGEKPKISNNGFVAFHKINGCVDMMSYNSINEWNERQSKN